MTAIRHLWSLFSSSERWKLLRVFLAVLMLGFLEVLGVASVMPFMALVANPDAIMEQQWLNAIYSGLGFQEPRSFLLFTGAAVLVLLTASNAFAAFTVWLILRFGWDKHHALSVRLLAKYLDRPYEWYLNRNTADFTKNILDEVVSVVHGLLIPALEVIARSVVSVAIILLLILIDVRLALALIVLFGGSYGTIYASFRRRQGRIGQERISANRSRFQISGEAFGAIKELKALGREHAFVEQFAVPSAQYSRHMASAMVLGRLPRYLLESVAFGGIVAGLLYLLAVRQDVDQVIPLITLYAVAGYRLLPSLQQIFHGVTQMRFNAAALDELVRDLELSTHRRSAVAALTPTGGTLSPNPQRIALDEVSFQYEGTSGYALRDINLEIGAGQKVAFVGPTGSGKTTLVDILLGLLRPTHGALAVDGTRVGDDLLPQWRSYIGYVPQSIYLCDRSLAENVALGVPETEIDRDAVMRAVGAAQLLDLVETLPAGLDTVVGERGVRLSGGQRQRVGIARALYHDPRILLLDEATSALDGVTEEAVMEAIEQLAGRVTIIIVAHRLTTVETCDRIFLLEDGRLSGQGAYQELVHRSAQFEAMTLAGRSKARE